MANFGRCHWVLSGLDGVEPVQVLLGRLVQVNLVGADFRFQYFGITGIQSL